MTIEIKTSLLILFCCLLLPSQTMRAFASSSEAELNTSTPTTESYAVVFPRAESNNDPRTNYPLSILNLALSKSGQAYTLKASDLHMQQSRSLRLLENNQFINVLWTVTSFEREKHLRPIRIPIDKGLIGWRLLLIHKERAPLFAAIDSKEQLARLRAGQGHDWPDYDILKKNGFNIIGSSNYESLFNMLASNHIEYFPRALFEVAPEIASHPKLPLMTEPNLLIHYPAALYFFVNKNNEILAQLIEQGLEAALADGSFQTLFDEQFKPALANAKLTQRHIIELQNPNLPIETPLDTARYWFTPEQESP